VVDKGCHAHFLTQSYTETKLQKTCEAYEWLNFYDTLQTALYQDQIGETQTYFPFCAQLFHELFSEEKSNPQLERNKQGWEVLLLLLKVTNETFEKEKNNKEMIESWIQSLEIPLKQIFNKTNFIIDFISFILPIITPDLKPVFLFHEI
jgi:hypothetical protein